VNREHPKSDTGANQLVIPYLRDNGLWQSNTITQRLQDAYSPQFHERQPEGYSPCHTALIGQAHFSGGVLWCNVQFPANAHLWAKLSLQWQARETEPQPLPNQNEANIW